jgi:LacI family transcriptional regulator
MSRAAKRRVAKADRPATGFQRVSRAPSLVAQVEQALRDAIAEDRFPDGKLPTEVELAEQLAVSRETVRLAAESLQREGLLVKIRHRGTFTRPPRLAGRIKGVEAKVLAYLQTDFVTAQGAEEVANVAIAGLMLQGALTEASRAGFKLEVQHTPLGRWNAATSHLYANPQLRGVILASYAEEKLLKRLAGQGVPTVLLDEETSLPQIHSVRDDCAGGARLAVLHLAKLGHRRIAYAHWQRLDSNRWRPMGYRQGLREAGLPRRRSWEIAIELTEQGTRELIDRFLGLVPRPTALYCFNNTLARYAIEELRRRGLRVPDDVSVMGAGGEEVPGLSCHQVDMYLMGQTAVQILLRAVAARERSKAEHCLCPHTICVGQTTGPAEKSSPRRKSNAARRTAASE